MTLALLLTLALGQAPLEGDPFAPLLSIDARFGDEAGAAHLDAEAFAELGPYADLLRARELRRAGQLAAAATLLAGLEKDAEPLIAANARLELAEVTLARGHAADARTQLRALLAHRPQPAELLSLAADGLGRACLALGDSTGARTAFEQAVSLDPDGDAAERALTALDSLQQQKPDRSRHGAREALMHARRLLRLGQAEAALRELSTVRAEGMLLGEVELCIAQCDRVLGRSQEAEAHLARALQVTTAKSGAAARIALARERELSGDWHGALADLTEVAAADTHGKVGTDALYLAAFIALQHQDMETARSLFGRLMPGRRTQHADEARWWLGWIDFQAAAYPAALEQWGPLLGGEGALAVQARYWAALAHEKLGQTAEAARLREELIKVSPLGYYALLLRGGEAPVASLEPGSFGVTPASCGGEGGEPDAAWLERLRRAELLWALGHADYAAEELHALAEHAPPARILQLSDAVAQLGDPGWAFNLALDRAQPCFASGSPLSPILFPRPYADAVNRAAQASEVDPLLLWAVMRQESHFRARARSAAQAFGPMQLLQTTAARVGAITGTAPGEPDDPATAMVTAAWYLRALMDRFGPNPAVVAAAYNAGPSAVGRWVAYDGADPLALFAEQIPFRETRRYVKTVLANYAAYHGLFGAAEGPLLDPKLPVLRSNADPAGVDF